MAHYEDVNTKSIALFGFLGAVAVFAVMILLQVLYYHVASRQQFDKDISQPAVELSSLVAEQQGRLEGYRWVDQKTKVVAIPIGRAMDLVLAEMAVKEGKRAGTAEAEGGGDGKKD